MIEVESLIKTTKRAKMCGNCVHASEYFKIDGITHHHCLNESMYPSEKMKSCEISPWDTLREWHDGKKCEQHEFKQQPAPQAHKTKTT